MKKMSVLLAAALAAGILAGTVTAFAEDGGWSREFEGTTLSFHT